MFAVRISLRCIVLLVHGAVGASCTAVLAAKDHLQVLVHDNIACAGVHLVTLVNRTLEPQLTLPL